MTNEDNSETKGFSDTEIRCRVRKRSLLARMKLKLRPNNSILNLCMVSAVEEVGKDIFPLIKMAFKNNPEAVLSKVGCDDYLIKITGTDLSNDYQRFLQELSDNGYAIRC